MINKGKLPDVIASRVVQRRRRRPQNWIALSQSSDTLHDLEELPPCPQLPKVPPFDFARRDTRSKPFIFHISWQAIAFASIQRYDCAPGNSYHVRIVNHQLPLGVVHFYKSILLRAQYLLTLHRFYNVLFLNLTLIYPSSHMFLLKNGLPFTTTHNYRLSSAKSKIALLFCLLLVPKIFFFHLFLYT